MQTSSYIELFDYIDQQLIPPDNSFEKAHKCDACEKELTNQFITHNRLDIDFCNDECLNSYLKSKNDVDNFEGFVLINFTDDKLLLGKELVNYYHSNPLNYSVTSTIIKSPSLTIKMTKKYYRYCKMLVNINTPSNYSKTVTSKKEMYISHFSIADWIVVRDGYSVQLLLNVNTLSEYYNYIAFFIIDALSQTGIEVVDMGYEELMNLEAEFKDFLYNCEISKIEFLEWVVMHKLKLRYIFINI